MRGQEHFESSKKVTASLHFYDMYPTSTCTRALNQGTKGTFESLQQVIGAGWSPSSDTAKLLDRSWKDGGLLIFNEKVIKQIRASMEKGMTDIQNFTTCALINLKLYIILSYPRDAAFLRVQDLNPCWEYMVVSSRSNERWLNNCEGIIKL